MSSLVAKPKGYERQLSRTADPRDTVRLMERIARQNAWQVEKLAKSLDGKDRLRRLWQWVRENIEYEEDPKGSETLRTPARTAHDGKGDCDCMSILIAAVLENWNVRYAFKVVEVSRFGGWAHVYVIAYDGLREVPMDTVPEIRHFGHEHSHYKYFYHMANTVELGGISAQKAAELKEMLTALLLQMQSEDIEPEDIELRNKEAALLKSVIVYMDKEPEALALILKNAVNQSVVLQDLYISIIQGEASGELGSLFSKIKDGLDKLGDTGIGKVFRSVRDKVVPIVDPMGISKIGGNVFNKIADKDSVSNSQKPQTAAGTMTVPAGSLPAKDEGKGPATTTTEKETAKASEDAKEPWHKQKMWRIGMGIGGGLLVMLLLWLAFRPKTLSGTRRRRVNRAAAARRRKRTLNGIGKASTRKRVAKKRRSSATAKRPATKKRKATAATPKKRKGAAKKPATKKRKAK